MEDDTIKKFKNLKVSSSQQSGSLELMFKKKPNKNLSSSISSGSGSATSVSSATSSLAKSKMKTRSRSHSRSKLSYLASAATAIKTVCKTSPSSSKAMLSSISTQTTCSSQSLVSSSEDVNSTISNCYLNTNIITSTIGHNPSMMNFIDGRPIKTCLPSRSDFFIWYSSARGFVSHRDADGSPFIKCLVTVFSRCAYELELIEMVRKVNLLMQQYEKRHWDERNAVASYFMVPVAEFHLAKRLYFNP